MNFEVRISGPPTASVPAIRRAVRSVDPDLALIDVGTQEETIVERLDEERSLAKLVGLFGGLALLVAALGLYGTLSYTLAKRIREIGIRMLVGAAGPDVLRMVFRETLTLAGLGCLIGVPAAVAASKLIASRLYGIAPVDPAALAGAAAILAAITVLGAIVPAWRAARIDPLAALRRE